LTSAITPSFHLSRKYQVFVDFFPGKLANFSCFFI